METLSQQEEQYVTEQLVKEFLECRLGYAATAVRIKRLASYINAFEKIEENG